MDQDFSQLFPCLIKSIDPTEINITLADLQTNCFFSDLVDEIISKYELIEIENRSAKKKKQPPAYLRDITQFYQVNTLISKTYAKCIPLKVPKGTVIYTVGNTPNEAYLLLHGCVELLSKKNSWQKLQNFQGHTCLKIDQRMNYLQSNFKIDLKHFQTLENLFYEQKMLFNWLPFRTIYSKGYFGFREMLRGSLRTKMAVAVQDCILLKIKKLDYEKYLKQFEEKREKYIIQLMLAYLKADTIQQISPKLSLAFNSAELISYERSETVIKEYEFSRGIYFLLKGELIVSKDVKIQVPKKYLTNQNRGQFVKEMVVRLHKIVQNTFIGQIQSLLSIKNRQFTFQASTNNTLLIKFDSAAFIKSISESSLLQRQITLAAKYKYSTMMDAYTRSKSQIIRSYFNQFQQLDHKKKQKNVTSLLNNQGTFKQNQLYELFKKQGVFYRDSFERLQGFQQFEAKYDPKRGTINRHKINSLSETTSSPTKLKIGRPVQQPEPKNTVDQNQIELQAAKRMLMSPKKTINPFQMINSQLTVKLLSKADISSQKRISSSMLPKPKKVFSKFQQLKKNEDIHKRVLIQNGLFQQDRSTNKTNIIEPIVNHKFDQVVKLCITKKNHALRKALIQHRDDIIKSQFMRTVSTLPNRSASLSGLGSASYGFTCKGTDQMRKRLQKLKHNRKFTVYQNQKTPTQSKGLEDCIGFNRKPLSSDINMRSTFFPAGNSNRSPEKIVLINHMMKPITYTSTQT